MVLGEVFYPMPEGTAFPAYFGHMVAYDAGYYGDAWADAIAADMATVFPNSPDGLFDEKMGRKLRDEICAVGNSRDANVFIEKFLGRARGASGHFKQSRPGTAAARRETPGRIA